jgi:uncharacterized protein YbaP (TraB family)
MKKKFILPIVAMLLLLMFTACGGSDNGNGNDAAPPTNVGGTLEIPYIPGAGDITPLMWHVTSPEGNTMYLFGSIHAGEPSIYPLPAFIMDAFHRTDYLAVEVNMYAFENDMMAMMEMISMMMFGVGDEGIIYDLGEDLHARVVAVLEESSVLQEAGIPIEMLNMYRSPMWNDMLMLAVLNRTDLTFEYGLDMYFIHAAMARGMEILEVESWRSQVEMLLGFSQELRRVLIEGALDIEEGAQGLRDLYALWKSGNEAELTALINDRGDMPVHLWEEYMNAMLYYRDIGMTEVARQYMRDGKKVFYVVGLAHLLGQDSVVYNLRSLGYTVEVIRG